MLRTPDKHSELRQISAQTPYELKITGAVAHVILRGVHGKGKITYDYKTLFEQKQTMQYFRDLVVRMETNH